MYKIFRTPAYTCRYFLAHPWELPLWICDDLTYAWQRAWRGYADIDVWNWESFTAAINIAALRQLRDTGQSLPINFDAPRDPHTGAPAAYTCEEWAAILNQMIAGFEAYLRWASLEYPEGMSSEQLRQAVERDITTFKAGMAAYNEHYASLWD